MLNSADRQPALDIASKGVSRLFVSIKTVDFSSVYAGISTSLLQASTGKTRREVDDDLPGQFSTIFAFIFL